MPDRSMTLLWLRPGTADRFACENCLRDRTLSAQWTHDGIAIVSAAIYLPLAEQLHGPVFYGALRAWLGTQTPWLRTLPSAINRLLDHPRVLATLASHSRTTDPQQGAALTEAMLTGNYDPRMDAELFAYVRHLSCKPTRIILSTPLLAHQGRLLAHNLQCPWYSLLGGEEHWVEQLGGDRAQRVWSLMRTESATCAAFVRDQGDLHPLIHQHMQPNAIIDATDLQAHGSAQ